MLLNTTRILRLAALLVVTCSTLANRSQAAGFLIYEASAASVAKGSAVSAYIDEPAAVWFNPAAISFMPGYRFQIGGILATGGYEFDPEGEGPTVKTEPAAFVLPTIFGTFEILDWLHAGIGVSSPWGTGISWPEDWVGREFCIKSEMLTVLTNPSVSFKVWQDRLSIGGGFSVLRASIDLTNGLPAAVGGTVRFGGATWGYGGNAGILFRILPNVLHAAFAYRSRIALSASGKADFTLASEELGQELYDQGVETSVTIPDIFTLGVMYVPTENLILGFDVNYTLWSVYEELKVTFEDGLEEISEKNWKDIVTFRLSADYALPINGLNIMGGIVYDNNPSPKETLAPDQPDANRFDFSIGAGYRYDWFKADLGYMLSWFVSSKAKTGQEGPEGAYTGLVHLIGLTVAFQFGTEDEDDVDPELSSVAWTSPTDYR
ncbi:MAG: outer membrane protein transport protein [Myxococcota bacterium]|nr:outer membrane protein transport protein [Myxococcota bacterium]